MTVIVLTPFDSAIERFNAMYKLPMPDVPTLKGFDVALRMEQFGRVYENELKEGADIIDKIRRGEADRLDIMVDVADWLGDLTVYATSEALRYGMRFEQPWMDGRLLDPEAMTDTELVHTLKLFTNAQRSSILTNRHLIDEAMSKGDDAGVLHHLGQSFAQSATHASTTAWMLFGLPINGILNIIMESNFSKLGADGLPIYDADNKVQKGPNYWKPEPKLKELLTAHIKLTAERVEADKVEEAAERQRQYDELRKKDAGAENDIDPDDLDAGE